MKYEGYTTQQRVDDLLDKISKSGIKSLYILEKKFLDAHSNGFDKVEFIHNELIRIENETLFEDVLFKFELTDTILYGDETHYVGFLTCPDIKFGNGKRIDGRLEGSIIVLSTGVLSPDFSKTILVKGKEVVYDIFEFCDGIEYELDSFIDYVVQELEK